MYISNIAFYVSVWSITWSVFDRLWFCFLNSCLLPVERSRDKTNMVVVFLSASLRIAGSGQLFKNQQIMHTVLKQVTKGVFKRVQGKRGFISVSLSKPILVSFAKRLLVDVSLGFLHLLFTILSCEFLFWFLHNEVLPIIYLFIAGRYVG